MIDVEHRCREPGAHQRVAEIVHVDESQHMAVRIDHSPCSAQLSQRIGTEAGEAEQAARREHAAKFREHGIRIAPREHAVAENEVYALVSERQPRGVRTYPAEAPEPRLLSRGRPQHAQREIQRDHAGRRIAALERPARAAGTGAGVDDEPRLDRSQIEALEQQLPHLGLHHGGLVIGPRRTIERTAQPRDVEGVWSIARNRSYETGSREGSR